MSARKSPKLAYFPETPYPGCDENSNGLVIAASVILVVLLLFIVIGGIMYWCNSSNNSNKVLAFADSKDSKPKELMECSKELVEDLMSGKVKGPVVIAFVAPWCGHCNNMKPALQEAAKESASPIYTLTHDKDKPYIEQMMKALKVQGFPMLFKLEGGNATAYKGDRSKGSIVEFAK